MASGDDHGARLPEVQEAAQMSTRAEIIEATLARAHAEIGTRETTSNWGPKVAAYLRETGITFPAPWCAAYTFAIIDRTCLFDWSNTTLSPENRARSRTGAWAVSPISVTSAGTSAPL